MIPELLKKYNINLNPKSNKDNKDDQNEGTDNSIDLEILEKFISKDNLKKIIS